MQYNLIERPWIPLLRNDGVACRVGIREALASAGGFRQLAASNPIDNVALFRLLLAVLLWCRPTLSEKDRSRLVCGGGVPEDWLTQRLGPTSSPNPYFDLLHPDHPFYQDKSVAVTKTVSSTYLLFELPSGTNIAHFRHTRDGRDGLCLKCCAIGLVRWSCVASAGTKGPHEHMTASLNGQTPAYATAHGPTLLTTLRRAASAYTPVADDSPAWSGASELTPLGYLKGLTWQSRRVLLCVPPRPSGNEARQERCYLCGNESDRLVTSIHFRPGWRRPGKEPWRDDPHLLQVKRATKSGEKTFVPSWPNPAEALQTAAEVRLEALKGLLQRVAEGSGTESVRFEVVLVGTSQALYKHVASESFALPLLTPDTAQVLLEELEWARRFLLRTTDAQVRSWSDPPKVNAVVAALYPRPGKGHTLRSYLGAHSFGIHTQVELALHRLMLAVVFAGGETSEAIDAWREDVGAIVSVAVEQGVQASTAGSPLRSALAVRLALQRVERWRVNTMLSRQTQGGDDPRILSARDMGEES